MFTNAMCTRLDVTFIRMLILFVGFTWRDRKQQAICRTAQRNVSAEGLKAKIHWTHVAKKTRVGMPDAHVGTKAGNNKNSKTGNDVLGSIEKRHWLVH